MGGSVVDFVVTMGQIPENLPPSVQECEMDVRFPMFVVRTIYVAVLWIESRTAAGLKNSIHRRRPQTKRIFSYAHTNVEQDAR
jgi:hypothetical protein